MARNFITVTQTHINNKIAKNLQSREHELMSYDFEAANHAAAIDTLGDIAWDAKTLPYKGLHRDAMISRALGDGLTADDIKRIADLNALDHHRLNLHAVQIETARSEMAYANLLAALPDGPERDEALATLAEAK